MGSESPSVSTSRRHFLAILSAASVRASAISAIGGSLAACKRDKNHRKDPPCFLRGTRILTSNGEIAVEDLSIGDLVPVRGGLKPIRWIGHRAYERTGGDIWQEEIRPIQISRGAIAPQIPHRDLYLSPRHCLFLGGLLIRAKDLVNGVSIRSEAPPDIERIEYFHVLLENHEVLKAEGAEAETLLMLSADHERFTNFVEYERLFSNQQFVPMTPFAPIHSYRGGRSHLAALVRIAASSCVDVRDPFQREYDRLSARTKECVG